MGKGTGAHEERLGMTLDNASLHRPFLYQHRSNPYVHQERQIALDVDSTIYPLINAMSSVGNLKTLDYPTIEAYEDLPGHCGGVERMKELFKQAMTFDVMKRIGLFPGTVQTLNALNEHGIRIHVMTTREPECRKDMERFLAEYAIPYESLACDMTSDKLALCRDRKIPILVDDHPEAIAGASTHGVQALSLAYPYNRASLIKSQIPQTKDWGQLGPLILDHLEAGVRRRLDGDMDSKAVSGALLDARR